VKGEEQCKRVQCALWCNITPWRSLSTRGQPLLFQGMLMLDRHPHTDTNTTFPLMLHRHRSVSEPPGKWVK
jgi:hypothetical protein